MPEGNVIDLSFLYPGGGWPWGILITAIFWALFCANSYASLRFLRKQPDFQHKEEMIWGALWWPIIFTAAMVASYVILVLGFLGPGDRVFLLIWISWTTIIVFLYYGLGSWTMRGPGVIGFVRQVRRKGKPFDLQHFLEGSEKIVQSEFRWQGLVLAICAIPWAVVTAIWLLSLFLD